MRAIQAVCVVLGMLVVHGGFPHTAGAAATDPLEWTIVDVASDLVDGDKTVMGRVPIAVTGDGGLRIAYVNAADELMFGLCDAGCTTPAGWSIIQVPASTPSAASLTLELDPADHPHLFYDGAFYTAAAGDGSDPEDWSIAIDLGEHLSVTGFGFLFALNPDGKPRISSLGELGLCYGGCEENCDEGSNWTCDPNYFPLGIEDYAATPSIMTVASSSADGDAPRIIWQLFGSMGRTGTYYLGCDGGCGNGANWFDHLFPDRWPGSLVTTSDGLPRFSAFEPWGEWTGLLVCLDSGCDEVVSISLENGPGPVALTAADQPRTVVGVEGGGLAYAACDEGCDDPAAWTIQEVLTGADVYGPVLAVDGADLPRIAFEQDGVLRVAIASPAPPPWGTASVAGAGSGPSSGAVGGLLALLLPLAALVAWRGLRRG